MSLLDKITAGVKVSKDSVEYSEIKLTEKELSEINKDRNAIAEVENIISFISEDIVAKEKELQNEAEKTYDAKERIDYFNNLVDYYTKIMEVKNNG